MARRINSILDLLIDVWRSARTMFAQHVRFSLSVERTPFEYRRDHFGQNLSIQIDTMRAQNVRKGRDA